MTTNLRITVDDLAWMAGLWRCDVWGGQFEETWLEPAGGTMVGMGRHVTDGETKFIEYMSIEPTQGGLTMWMLLGAPSKGEKHGVPFRLTSYDGTVATFSNPENGYPSRIVYRRTEEAMSCRLEGETDGKPAFDDFDFRRA
jgi:hypothetical protein